MSWSNETTRVHRFAVRHGGAVGLTVPQTLQASADEVIE
jgi:hypothetical protein